MSPADATLAALLFFQTPGQSPYSTVVVERCEGACGETPLCSEPVLACRPPHHSASRGAWLRYETFDEGVARYALVAEVIAEVAQTSTWRPRADCEPPRHGGDVPSEACASLYQRRPWTGSEAQLRLLLATVVGHESTIRRDVHEGTTRGDCDYVEIAGRRVLVEGSCRSHCLGQVMVGRGAQTRRGYASGDLVGLDLGSTRRCIETVADRLSDAHRLCSRGIHTGTALRPACVLGIYGAVPGWQRDPRIAARAKTYGQLRSQRRPLSARVLKALGREAPDE